MDLEKLVPLLMSAQPIVLLLLAFLLGLGVLYKTVPVLVQAARHTLKDSSARWADRDRVERIASRVHDLASYNGTVLMLKAKVEKLEDSSGEDLRRLEGKLDEHITEDMRVHTAEQMVASARAERLRAVEATQEAQLDLLKKIDNRTDVLTEDIKEILKTMPKRRGDE